MVIHTFNPSTKEQRLPDLCEFGISLVFIVSSGQPGLPSETLTQEKKKKTKTPNDVAIQDRRSNTNYL